MEKPTFHIILNDQGRWAVEAEWYDGTLERVMTFQDHTQLLPTGLPNTRNLGFRFSAFYLRRNRSGTDEIAEEFRRWVGSGSVLFQFRVKAEGSTWLYIPARGWLVLILALFSTVRD